MYQTHFQMSALPFRTASNGQCFFPTPAREQVLFTLSRVAEQAVGIGLLVGGVGSGKTSFCHRLAEDLSGGFRVAIPNTAGLRSRRDMLQAVLHSLCRPYRDMEEGELRLTLIDFLNSSELDGQAVLLLIDEADTLPLSLLEELRMITNVVTDGVPRVRLVLIGVPRLEEHLSHARLSSLNQRVAARCYLQSFNRQETAEYSRFQIQSCGGEPDRVFSKDALDAVYEVTDGVPRLIDQLCDHAMVMALEGGRQTVGRVCIHEAWADLQRLPPPGPRLEQKDEIVPGIIEFGPLEDDNNTDINDSRNAESDFEQELSVRDPEESLDEIQHRVSLAASDVIPYKSDADDPTDHGRSGKAVSESAGLNYFDPDTPFHEEFDEEEVLLDRVTSLRQSQLGLTPVVSSNEAYRAAEASVCGVAADQPAGNLTGTDDRAAEQVESTVDGTGIVCNTADDKSVPSVEPDPLTVLNEFPPELYFDDMRCEVESHVQSQAVVIPAEQLPETMNDIYSWSRDELTPTAFIDGVSLSAVDNRSSRLFGRLFSTLQDR